MLFRQETPNSMCVRSRGVVAESLEIQTALGSREVMVVMKVEIVVSE